MRCWFSNKSLNNLVKWLELPFVRNWLTYASIFGLTWILGFFLKILILTRLAVLEGKAHMQLNLTFFPLPNFTEVILDQDIECRPQPPENDQNTNKVIH